MENVADALKMAFAFFIFIMAFSLTIYMFTSAKDMADFLIFTSDETNYHEYAEAVKDGDKTKLKFLDGTEIELHDKGRLVKIDKVISTIYKCIDETMVVKVKDGANEITFDSAEDKGALNSKIKEFVEDAEFSDTYLEQYVETKYSGQELTADDGSTITLTKGGTKMYITYTKQT